MTTTSLQLPEHVKTELKVRAEKTGMSVSRLMRLCIENQLKQGTKMSALEAFGDLVGSLEGGPKDLSARQAFESYPDDPTHVKNSG